MKTKMQLCQPPRNQKPNHRRAALAPHSLFIHHAHVTPRSRLEPSWTPPPPPPSSLSYNLLPQQTEAESTTGR